MKFDVVKRCLGMHRAHAFFVFIAELTLDVAVCFFPFNLVGFHLLFDVFESEACELSPGVLVGDVRLGI